MILILIAILIILLLLSLAIYKGDIIAPSVISCAMFLLSSIVACMNITKWNFIFHGTTILVISLGLILFLFGSLCSKSFFKKQPVDFEIYNIKGSQSPIKISKTLFWFSVFFTFFGTYIFYRRVQTIIATFDYGDMYALNALRYLLIQNDAKIGASVALLEFLVFGIAFVFLYVFLYNVSVAGQKIRANWYYLFPSIGYFVISTFTSNRSGFILYISYFIFMWVIFYYYKNNWKVFNMKSSVKIISLCILLLILYLIIFRLLGYLTGKSQNFGLYDTLSVYIGGSIVGLDNFLKNSAHSFTNVFGEETIIGIRLILQKFGVKVSETKYLLEFTQIGTTSLTTNVFTSLRRYIHDYGLFGMMFIQFILGFFYTFFYNWIKRKNYLGFGVIVYCYLSMGLVYQSIEEQFLLQFGSVTQIFTLLFCGFVYFWIYRYNKKMDIIENE